MVTLDPGFAALAAFQSCHLLAFAVQLLNSPAEATRPWCRLGGILNGVVGHDPVRAGGGGHLNPEQAHLLVLGETLDFDDLAVFPFGRMPGQRVYPLIGRSAAGVVHLAVVLEWAVINFPQQLDEQHQLLSGIPAILEHRLKGRLLVMDGIRQLVTDRGKLGVALPVRIVEAVVDEPELIVSGLT
jgi:hypothetical protein